ncbi:MAG: hypothetical protein J0I06_12970 [Planctomycetes bacterium]|nr:hypothetical protein [Planctomycetota bacterium]
MGVMRGYPCERCPLAFEIGGYAFWELDGRLEQAVCRACGTMHRLTERRGGCEVTALPGPVRSLSWVVKTAEWYAARYDQTGLQWLAEMGVNICPVPGEEAPRRLRTAVHRTGLGTAGPSSRRHPGAGATRLPAVRCGRPDAVADVSAAPGRVLGIVPGRVPAVRRADALPVRLDGQLIPDRGKE